jgi:protease-4
LAQGRGCRPLRPFPTAALSRRSQPRLVRRAVLQPPPSPSPLSLTPLQAVAQGRVWSGTRAAQRGLVDVVGGLWEAIGLAKQAAGIPAEEKVTVAEVSRTSTSPLALLAGGGASAAVAAAAFSALARGAAPADALRGAVGVSALQQLAAAAGPVGVSPAALLALLGGLQQGQALAFDFDAAGIASAPVSAISSAFGGASGGISGGGAPGSGGASLFEEAGPWAGLAAADEAVSGALEEWLL